jgi:alpha-beta hydrolase superfamily lysophospholipase
MRPRRGLTPGPAAAPGTGGNIGAPPTTTGPPTTIGPRRPCSPPASRRYRASVQTQTDVLGAPYERRRIALPPDDEGEVEATLVSLRAPVPTRRAVLYLHGYVDYFFQTHLAEFFTSVGYDFYALDLRKYGRSLLAHQTPNFCTDIAEYFPEIDAAIAIIRDEDGHDTLVLNGHSTGGLIAALYADRVRGQGVVHGLFLNSPFLEFNEPWIKRRGFAPVVRLIGRLAPKAGIGEELGTLYGTTIHADYDGQWRYDLNWKPLNGFKIQAGWVRAISLAHRRVQRGLAIDVPVLLACSTRSYKGKPSEAAHHADTVLNVADMVRYGPRLGPQVTLLQVDGGLHDLTLSAPPVRQTLFDEVRRWLAAQPGLGVGARQEGRDPAAP